MGLNVLGVEVTAGAVKCALVRNDKHPKILSYERFSLPSNAWANGALIDGAAVAEAVRTAIAQNKAFSKAEAIAVSVNTPQTVVRPVHLPMLTEKELRPALEFELSQSFPGLAKTHAIAFKEYARSGSGIDGIVSFSPYKAVDAYKALLDGFSYKSAYLDVLPNCEAKAYAALCAASATEKNTKPTLLCNIGSTGSQLTIAEQGRILHSRQIPEGDSELVDELCRRFSITVERYEQLREEQRPIEGMISGTELYERHFGVIADQIRQTIEFFQTTAGAAPIAGVVLTGDNAHLPGLCAYLSSALALEVSAPLSADKKPIARMLAALGAAIREV